MSVAANTPRSDAAVRRLFTRADNPVVRSVARLPAKLRTKLLAAFLAIAALLVLVSLLGVRVLGQANSRSEGLRTLQKHQAGYQAIEAQATIVRDIIGLCAGGTDVFKFANGGKAPSGSKGTVVTTALSDLNTVAQVGFKPFADEAASLHAVTRDTRQLRRVMGTITGSSSLSKKLQKRAGNRANDLKFESDALARRTTRETDVLVAANSSSYRSSRNLFIGAAAGAVALALLLGYFLSWSLIGPIQRIVGRLAGIASGDFSRHVEVANRDELGDLAGRVNQMNDELQRVYRELEPAQERVPREHVARAAHAAQRDPRLLSSAGEEAVRRAELQAGGVRRGHPLLRQPPALADQRRARPLEGRGGPDRAGGGAVLPA
jgi:HAMP domain-containing protein